MKINTVNVMIFKNTEVTSLEKIISFPDNHVGNKEADATFASLVRSYFPYDRMPIDEIDDIISEGCFTSDDGKTILISHLE